MTLPTDGAGGTALAERTERPAGGDPPRRTRRLTAFGAFASVVALAFACLIAYPIFRVVSSLVWSDGRFSISAITATLHLPNLFDVLRDTAVVVIASGTLALAIGSAFAWLNERTNARIPGVTDVLPVIPFLVPTIAGATGWLFLLSPQSGFANWAIREVLDVFGVHLTRGPLSISSWYGVIFVYTIDLVPFVFLVVSAGLRAMDTSLEEQSRVCGAGLLRTLFRVTLPAMRLSLLGAGFLVAWFGLAVFSVPLVLATPAHIDMLSYQIVALLEFSSPAQLGPVVGLGSVVMLVLATIWFVQRKALRSQRFSILGGKSQRGRRIPLSPWARGIARVVLLGYLVVAAVLPVLALLLVALNGFWTTHIRWDRIGFHSFADALRSAFAFPGTGLALKNSVLLAAASATVGLAVAGLISWWTLNSRNRLAAAASLTIKIPAAVSTVVLAVGFVLAFGGPPAYLGGTVVMLFLAYLAIAMPEASVTAESAIGQVGRDLGEASRVAGAGEGRTFARVYVPLMMPGLAAGWALVFVRIVGDLEASAILAGTGNPVVGFQILGLITSADYAGLAALALLLTALSATVVAAVLMLVRRFSVRAS